MFSLEALSHQMISKVWIKLGKQGVSHTYYQNEKNKEMSSLQRRDFFLTWMFDDMLWLWSLFIGGRTCLWVSERGKEWRSEAPAEWICLAAVSFCHIKDYGRITTNEQEDKQHINYPVVCEWACHCQWNHSFICCLFWLVIVTFTAGWKSSVTIVADQCQQW